MVYGSSDQLFAASGFALDEDGQFGGRDAFNSLTELLHGAAFAEELAVPPAMTSAESDHLITHRANLRKAGYVELHFADWVRMNGGDEGGWNHLEKASIQQPSLYENDPQGLHLRRARWLIIGCLLAYERGKAWRVAR